MKKYLITTITILFVCSCMLYGCSENDAVLDDDFVRTPTKVLEDVNMVWVETIDSRGISNTYTIKPNYVNFNNNNLFAITNDGTIMMTGKDVGTAEKEVEVSGDLDNKSTSTYVDVFTPVILH